MYDTVITALRRGAADEALAAARELVEQHPDDIKARNYLAAAQRQAGDRDGALATLDAALIQAPDDPDLHLARAGALTEARNIDEAAAALARTLELDPNRFAAYVMQAQLAIVRGDLDDADRVLRTAARLAPQHPELAAVEGMIALQRGRPDHALTVLTKASKRHPDEPSLHYPLGLALMAQGHLAFAEQAFRRALPVRPDALATRALISEVMRRQGRAGEAADELRPLLADPAAPPAMHRQVGMLDLEAGRVEQAITHLKHVLAHQPGDRDTLSTLVHAWQKREDMDDARSTLDAALATHPALADLWLARLSIEPFGGAEARAVIDRWIAAMPDHAAALMARVTVLDNQGDRAGAEAAARRVVEAEPGHTAAELRLIDGLFERDPDAAMARVRELAERVPDPRVQRTLRTMLGRLQDEAGRPEEAVETWLALRGDSDDQQQPPPELTGYTGPWPERAPLPEKTSGTLFLWGAPGSMVERVVRVFEAGGAPIRIDRLGPNPPTDPLQRLDTPQALVDGSLDGGYLIGQWRAALPGRGITGRQVFEWLPVWDNALLLALRPHLPEGLLLIPLRDPRDMLLDWLVYGSPVAMRFESPVEAARWLAACLEQVADLHEQDLYRHRIVRLDGIAEDPQAVAQALADAISTRIPVPPARAMGSMRLPTGHWERFASILDEAFDLLAPVAARLGYTV